MPPGARYCAGSKDRGRPACQGRGRQQRCYVLGESGRAVGSDVSCLLSAEMQQHHIPPVVLILL